MSSSRKIVKVLTRFPEELVRVIDNRVRLRVQQPGKSSYDVILNNGKVQPAAKPGSTFVPNGMSMRSATSSKVVIKNYIGEDVKVYTIPKNTKVPSGLVLVEDHYKGSQHYSLQPKQEMTKADLDATLQSFLDTVRVEERDSFVARKYGSKSS